MTTTTLNPSQQLRAAEQEERNERIDAYIETLRQKFLGEHSLDKSTGSCKAACAAPDLLLQISILLTELEKVGLLRRRSDIEHVSYWISNIAFALKPALAIEVLEAADWSDMEES